MLQIPHTIGGLLIASQVDSLVWAPVLALGSHFLLDMIPHWDYFTNGKDLPLWKKLAILGGFAVSVGISVLYAITSKADSRTVWRILLCAGAANLPDALEIPHFLGKKNAVTSAILKVQRFFHWKAPLPWGLLPQAALVLFGLLLLFGSR